MLTYNRTDNVHAWRDRIGRIALWQGFSAWYFIALDGTVRRLCDLSWPDGDAIAFYQARMMCQRLTARLQETLEHAENR